MSVPLNVNGIVYDYPEVDDTDWGAEATDWAAAVTTGMLQKAGGLFQLLAEADFGTSFGIKSLYFKSRTANPAAAGQVRFARADVLSWRNQANSADLPLAVDAGNNLTFNGVALGGAVTVLDTDSIDLEIAALVLQANLNLSAAAAGAGFINAVATIESDGLQVQVPIADTSTTGVLTDTDWDIFNAKQPAGNYITALTGDVVAAGPGSVAAAIQSGVITNAMINASAAIAFSKLASLTSAHILVGSAGNVATDVAVTGDISLTNAGVTAYAGTVPLNKGGTGQTTKAAAFDALSPMNAGGQIIYGGASGTGTALANGSAGQVLTSAGTTLAPTWATPSTSLQPYRLVITTDSATTADQNLYLTGSNFTQTLYTAVGNAGRILTIVHGGTSLTNLYTLATNPNTQTIGGIASGSYILYTAGESLTVISDGTNWQILDHKSSCPAVTYTPTLSAGFGTTSVNVGWWWRNGQWMFGNGYITAGTTAGSLGTISLPNSMVINTSIFNKGNTTAAPGHCAGSIGGATGTNATGWLCTATGTSTTVLYHGQGWATSGGTTPANSSLIFSNSSQIFYNFMVPIVGFQP